MRSGLTRNMRNVKVVLDGYENLLGRDRLKLGCSGTRGT
jgi:hypothetical protein